MDVDANEGWVRELLLSVKDKRLEQLEGEFAQDGGFLALSSREETLREIMKEDMSDRLRSRLLRQEEIGSRILSLAEAYFYEKGFTDCLHLLRMLLKEGRPD